MIDTLTETWSRIDDPNNMRDLGTVECVALGDDGAKHRFVYALGRWFARGIGKSLPAPDGFRWLPNARVYRLIEANA